MCTALPLVGPETHTEVTACDGMPNLKADCTSSNRLIVSDVSHLWRERKYRKHQMHMHPGCKHCKQFGGISVTMVPCFSSTHLLTTKSAGTCKKNTGHNPSVNCISITYFNFMLINCKGVLQNFIH